jgi:hypothetical protein
MLIIYIYGIKWEMVVDVPCKCVQTVMFRLVNETKFTNGNYERKDYVERIL